MAVVRTEGPPPRVMRGLDPRIHAEAMRRECPAEILVCSGAAWIAGFKPGNGEETSTAGNNDAERLNLL
jgi:hypothetical protein